MSAGVSSGGNSQDFELNLASIIDCFTVLIAFMLASASFLSIGILDAGVAAAGAQANAGTPPSVNLTVELGAANRLSLKLTGKVTSNQAIEPISGKPDYEGLKRALGEAHAKYADVTAVTLVADNEVQYKDVIKAMEETHKTIPVVLLGGF